MAFTARTLAHAAILLALAPASFSDSLTTLFAGNAGPQAGGGTQFEVTVTHPNGILIRAMDLNVWGHEVAYTVKIYETPGTYLGKELDPQAWTLVAQASGISEYHNIPTHVDLPDFRLTPGSHGLAVYFETGSIYLTNGNGSNQAYGNADLSLRLGATTSQLFAGMLISPRVFNGTIYYDGGPPATTVYCAGWPGGVHPPEIHSTGTPSASASSGFTLFSFGQVVPGAPGILMYSLHGRAALPFGGGTLCIQPPVRRTTVATVGVPSPDGLQLDMNAFAGGALGGNPRPELRVSGTVVDCQWWQRRFNPPPHDVMLTDALEYTVEP